MKLNHVIVVLVIALAAAMLHGTEAKKYQVGGDLGWTVPPGGASTYASWASKHTLKVDKDTLVFDFKAGENDLTIVTKENYDSCNTKDPLYQFKSPGVVVGASTPGTFYLTCSFAGHCHKGQKVAIDFAPSLTGQPRAALSPSLSPSPSASDEDVTTEQLKIMMMA
ncbi:hypothetical protein ACLB2K_054735 [Fragaria x ananassa]